MTEPVRLPVRLHYELYNLNLSVRSEGHTGVERSGHVQWLGFEFARPGAMLATTYNSWVFLLCQKTSGLSKVGRMPESLHT